MKKGKFLLGVIILLGVFILGGLITFGVLSLLKKTNVKAKVTEVIKDVPVKLIYNEEAYVVEGAPKTVNMTVTGKKSDVESFKEMNSSEVTLDLSKYSPSDKAYKVDFSYEKNEKLTYELDPNYAKVVIKNKVSSVISVQYKLINEDKLDSELKVTNVMLSKQDVVIRGSESALENVASVKALVDLSGSNFTEVGVHEINNVKLVAYDSKDKELDNVEIASGMVSAVVVLGSQGRSKKVPIKLYFEGVPKSGKSISDIKINDVYIDDFKVTVFGEEDVLDAIEYISVEINIDGSGSNGLETYNVTLLKPNGVTELSVSNVEITIQYSDTIFKDIIINNIKINNLDSWLQANIVGEPYLIMSIEGSADVINNIDSDDIEAYVDLQGYGEGTWQVKVALNSDYYFVYEIKEITVNISRK